EPAVRTDSESIRDEKVKVLRAIRPLEQRNLVRGQFRGYRSESGGRPHLAGGDLCGPPTGDRFVALARRALLHQGGQMLARDLYRGLGPTASASHDVSRLRSAAELVPFSDQPRRHAGLWFECPSAGAGLWPVRGTVGEPPPRRGRNG